jgi:arylsulfatase A-like enzyme
MMANHPEHLGGFYPVLDGELEVNAMGGGETGAPQVHDNPVPRDCYHTDWVADRAIAWLDGLDAEDDWFCWVSFPDPHHPWDPPASELGRVPWRDVPLPAGYPEAASDRERILDAKPRHWRRWYDGELVSNYEAPAAWVPATLTADQLREVNARNAVEVELIDEAVGRIMAAIAARGWSDDVDVVFTTDHGELQGDFGLLFKGPYHVDGLMRLPLIWRPAPSAGLAAAVVTQPVGLVDLAPTFCEIAGIAAADWMEGEPLPSTDASADFDRSGRVLTEWDSELHGTSVHLRTITRDGWVATACLASTEHDGTEGELYDLGEDPLQRANRWDDPALRSTRDDLLDDLRSSLPPTRSPRLPLEAPV